MLKLPEVEAAKALMTEGLNWSVLRWLTEKKRVRKAADLANDTLDAFERKIKASWSDELKAAYDELPQAWVGKEPLLAQPNGKGDGVSIHPEIRLLAKTIHQADEEAYLSHMDAEDTFDRAEKRLSTSGAREGSRKAIISWEVHEKAIEKAEDALHRGKEALKR
jgi:hypothetical protein